MGINVLENQVVLTNIAILLTIGISLMALAVFLGRKQTTPMCTNDAIVPEVVETGCGPAKDAVHCRNCNYATGLKSKAAFGCLIHADGGRIFEIQQMKSVMERHECAEFKPIPTRNIT